jgi:basic membrane protein A
MRRPPSASRFIPTREITLAVELPLLAQSASGFGRRRPCRMRQVNIGRGKMAKWKGWAGAIVLAAGVAAWLSPASAADPVKVGFVYVSPIGDAGWTFQHDTGRKEMEKALSGKVTSKFVEAVPEGVDAERVIRELAQSGNKIIFTTSFGYMNPTLKVAKQFPNTDFEHATGYKTDRNVGIYNARFYEGRYLAGIVAGKMTRSNIGGYVAAFPIPEVVMGINAFTRGMRSVNPKAEVKVIWVNAWFDPGREREAAETLVSQGADVLTHHTDSTAVMQAAEAKKVYAVAYHSDMSKYGPHAQLTAVTHQWGAYYTKAVQSVIDGTWKPGNVWGGIKEGMIKMGAFNPAVPKDVQDLVNKTAVDIGAGKFHPFTGPLKDNDGKERLAAGQVMTDEVLSKMDYYVEGVQGKLPK